MTPRPNTMLDERLGAAVGELRDGIDQIDPPAFKPNRRSTPAMLALVVLLAVGLIGYVVQSRPDDSGGIVVATQSEVPTASTPFVGQITQAPDGEYYMPIPGSKVWNADDTRLLLYRTGAGPVGHVVVSAVDPDAQAVELAFTPPDIEQIYWHPFDPNVVLYAAGASVLGFDVQSGETQVVHEYQGCDRIDSGQLPVPPSGTGVLSMLCYADGSTEQVVVDLATGTERRAETVSDSAAFPSPSGQYLVQWNGDGSATVLDPELVATNVMLDLQQNLFAFVNDADGDEWVVATLFDDPAIGTVVALPLDGTQDPVVLIGPSRGDSYPPSGNIIDANGSRIVVSTRGTADGASDADIAGNITVLDIAESLTNPTRTAFPHRSEGTVDFWSNPFVSLSRDGDHIAYSTDSGSESVNTFITEIEFSSE